MPVWSSLTLQQAASNLMEQACYFHDLTLLIITLILLMIGWVMVDLVLLGTPYVDFSESTMLEVWWTILPSLVLISLAIPSLSLLYLMDEVGIPDLSINVLGHQWFWEYNYPDFKGVSFESYMISDTLGQVVRLMDVDNRVVVPFNSSARVLISSTDVLHSWAMPSMGLKADATPGRLNQVNLTPWASGLFYGQCSEICGANHSFMPIVLEVISPESFIKWVNSWQ